MTLNDFVALARCLREVDGLSFYNSGPTAGASQYHKHLQLIPFSAAKADLPINAAMQAHSGAIADQQLIPTLPFQHRVHRLNLSWTQATDDDLGAALLQAYRQIMSELGLSLAASQPNTPYNLLITRDWLMGIQRSCASYQGISVNSLGYAGWLLVKTSESLEKLRQMTPLTLLTQVGMPRSLDSDRTAR